MSDDVRPCSCGDCDWCCGSWRRPVFVQPPPMPADDLEETDQ